MQKIVKQFERSGLSSFDGTVGVVLLGLVGAIIVVAALGDRVGVRVLRVQPGEAAHSTEPILVQFSENMDRESVTERLTIEPAVPGEIAWRNDTLILEPDNPLQPGTEYTLTLAAGALSQTGRRVLDDQHFTFDIRTPRVAYLAPTTQFPQDIFITDPLNPQDTRQVTQSETGIFDFSVSPDGTRIAFSEYDTEVADINIKIIDLETNTVQQVTNCRDATCTNPVWRPDGNALAYHRKDANTTLPGIGAGAVRIWLVELTGGVFNNRPLFDDFQIVGHSPQWSATGERIAVYDPTAPGILVQDFVDRSITLIPSWHGTMGTLSPDGMRLVFPDIEPSAAPPIHSYLQIANLEDGAVSELTNRDDAVDDTMAVWHPNGRDLAIARRYVDERFTRGTQIYRLNSETGAVEPLVVDPQYTNGFFSWDPTGSQLVLQRFQELDAQGTPTQSATTEVWVYNLLDDALIQVAIDAFLPRWVP